MSDAPPPPGQPPEQGGPPPPGWGAPPPPPPGGGYGQPPVQPEQPYGASAQYQQYGYGYGYGGGYAQYAGFWIRFGAAIIDGLIIGIPVGIVASIADGGTSFTASSGYSPGLNLTMNLLSIVVSIAYFGVLEGGATGQTLGKRLCSIRVVDATTGQPGIGFGRGAGRYLMSIVSGWVLAIGYLWMLWDPRKQTWHDKVVRTIVVKA